MNAITLYAAQRSAHFDDKLNASMQLLQQAQKDYTPQTIVQACSLGAEDMVVTELLHRADFNCPIFVLNTGKLHSETLALIARAEAHYQRSLHIYTPQADKAAAFEAEHGSNAMRHSVALRKSCCHIRKMEPLARALAGKRAWITGLRQEQSSARTQVQPVEYETLAQGQKRTKLNPLVYWTWGDIWHFIAQAKIPYNPLHDQFFPSIGCAPCTRAISVGEDFRAGRWWWEQDDHKECGLHTHTNTQKPLQTPILVLS